MQDIRKFHKDSGEIQTHNPENKVQLPAELLSHLGISQFKVLSQYIHIHWRFM